MEQLTWKDILLHCTLQVLKSPSLDTKEPGDSDRDTNGLLQQSPNFLAPQTSFTEDNFSMDRELGKMVFGWVKHITIILHFMSDLNAAADLTSRYQSSAWKLGTLDWLDRGILHEGSWSDTPPCVADAGQDVGTVSATQGRRRLALIEGIDIRWAHQFPGAN